MTFCWGGGVLHYKTWWSFCMLEGETACVCGNEATQVCSLVGDEMFVWQVWGCFTLVVRHTSTHKVSHTDSICEYKMLGCIQTDTIPRCTLVNGPKKLRSSSYKFRSASASASLGHWANLVHVSLLLAFSAFCCLPLCRFTILNCKILCQDSNLFLHWRCKYNTT